MRIPSYYRSHDYTSPPRPNPNLRQSGDKRIDTKQLEPPPRTTAVSHKIWESLLTTPGFSFHYALTVQSSPLRTDLFLKPTTTFLNVFWSHQKFLALFLECQLLIPLAKLETVRKLTPPVTQPWVKIATPRNVSPWTPLRPTRNKVLKSAKYFKQKLMRKSRDSSQSSRSRFDSVCQRNDNCIVSELTQGEVPELVLVHPDITRQLGSNKGNIYPILKLSLVWKRNSFPTKAILSLYLNGRN